MSTNNHYDIIIIGTGAGGGTLAYRLAQSGKKILLLGCGHFLPREKDNWNTKIVFNSDRTTGGVSKASGRQALLM